jgi:hypothetical protein
MERSSEGGFTKFDTLIITSQSNMKIHSKIKISGYEVPDILRQSLIIGVAMV